MSLAPEIEKSLQDVASQFATLELLLLFGSRARGTHHPKSDWDFAAICKDAADLDRLAAALMMALRSDHVDVVDLNRAGALVRYHAARDGKLLFESKAGTHVRFQIDAATFWAEAGPAIQRDYQLVLARLGPR